MNKLKDFLVDYNIINSEILKVESELGLNFRESIVHLIHERFLSYGIDNHNLDVTFDVNEYNNIIRNDLFLSFLHAVNFNVSDDNNYFILKYNTRYLKFYKNADVARSLVVNREVDNIQIISYGFHKFYNLGEKDVFTSTVQEKVDNSESISYYGNKLDGTNITSRFVKGDLLTNTTGSLSKLIQTYKGKVQPNYILEAEFFITNDSNYFLMLEENPDIAFIFELIGENNQIVVEYDKSEHGLYLIGARQFLSEDGVESRLISQEELISLSLKYNVLITDIKPFINVQDLVDMINSSSYKGKEGVVLYVDGNIYKVKADDYVLVHHLYMKKSLKHDKDLKEFINIIIPLLVKESFDDYLGVFKGNVPQFVLDIAEKGSSLLEIYDMLIKGHLEKGKEMEDNEFFKYISLSSNIDKNLKSLIITTRKGINTNKLLSDLLINLTFKEMKDSFVYKI